MGEPPHWAPKPPPPRSNASGSTGVFKVPAPTAPRFSNPNSGFIPRAPIAEPDEYPAERTPISTRAAEPSHVEQTAAGPTHEKTAKTSLANALDLGDALAELGLALDKAAINDDQAG